MDLSTQRIATLRPLIGGFTDYFRYLVHFKNLVHLPYFEMMKTSQRGASDSFIVSNPKCFLFLEFVVRIFYILIWAGYFQPKVISIHKLQKEDGK